MTNEAPTGKPAEHDPRNQSADEPEILDIPRPKDDEPARADGEADVKGGFLSSVWSGIQNVFQNPN